MKKYIAKYKLAGQTEWREFPFEVERADALTIGAYLLSSMPCVVDFKVVDADTGEPVLDDDEAETSSDYDTRIY